MFDFNHPTNEIHPSLLKRKIIHFDMDAFYAAIEMRDDPSLRSKPVVVGGSPDSRGVVCTANYEARKFGIHSAMACSQAKRLCPQAIFIKPNFTKYSEASQRIRAVFYKYTQLVEPLSLDEAYLDVTDNAEGLYAVKIAKRIQDEIYETIDLTGSAGVAPNKLLAKIASDIRKPKGLTVVLPEKAMDFMRSLPLRKIPGVGPVTEKRLAKHDFRLCSDVWPLSMETLRARVGNLADWLYNRSRGIDEREVQVSRVRKSLGREETFAVDILDLEQLHEELRLIIKSVIEDLRERNFSGRTITLKVKYADFIQVTRSHSVPVHTHDEAEITKIAFKLFELTEAGQRKIRLLGLSLSNLMTSEKDL